MLARKKAEAQCTPHQRALDHLWRYLRSGLKSGEYNVRRTHTMFVHDCKEAFEGGGRDEDSPATIYLIWLSWLHSQRPELLDAEAGTWRRRDAGKHGPQRGCLAFLSMHASTNRTWHLRRKKCSQRCGSVNQSVTFTSVLPVCLQKDITIGGIRICIITSTLFTKSVWCH